MTELVQEYIDEIGETPYFYQVTGVRPVVIGQEWKEAGNGTDRKK